MRASSTTAIVDVGAVPLLAGARELCSAGCSPGGTGRNLAWCGAAVEGGDQLTRGLLADPQTSGGLLFGVEPDRAGLALAALADHGLDAAVIGHVETGDGVVRLV
jgi:selenide,water dikinase